MAYQKQQAIVTGDGNAIGNHNRVTVIKKTKMVYKNDSTKGSGDDGGAFLGLAIGALIALLAACYYFALHAPTVYVLLRTLAGAELLLALLAAWYAAEEGANAVLYKCVAALGVALVATLFLMDAHRNYPPQLTAIAQQAAGVEAFWCQLNDLGRQLALQHTVTSSLGFVIGLLWLLPTTSIFAYFSLSEGDVSARTYALLERMTAWWMVVFAAVLVAAASYFHTESGWAVWQGWFQQPPSFFCAKV